MQDIVPGMLANDSSGGYFFNKGDAGWETIMAASALYPIPPIVFFLLVQRRMAGASSRAR